jgi:hypothetical protein
LKRVLVLIAGLILALVSTGCCEDEASQTPPGKAELPPKSPDGSETDVEKKAGVKDAPDKDAPDKDATTDGVPSAATEAPTKAQADAGTDASDPTGDVTEDEDHPGIPVEETEPFEAGDVYKGPPSKTIVGKWKISLPKSSIPKELPEKEREELAKLADFTMEFSGRRVTFISGQEKESYPYKVTQEEGITMQITAKKDKEEELIVITFYDGDNILINESRFPGPARGKRLKDK